MRRPEPVRQRYPFAGTANADVRLLLAGLDGSTTRVDVPTTSFPTSWRSGGIGPGCCWSCTPAITRRTEIRAVDPGTGADAAGPRGHRSGLAASSRRGPRAGWATAGCCTPRTPRTPTACSSATSRDAAGAAGHQRGRPAGEADHLLRDDRAGRAARVRPRSPDRRDHPADRRSRACTARWRLATCWPSRRRRSPTTAARCACSSDGRQVATVSLPGPRAGLRARRDAAGGGRAGAADRGRPAPRRRPPAGPLPIVMAPYGGPTQQVLSARRLFYEPQWLADQGFAVIVADGRGSPGRGPGWERAFRFDVATRRPWTTRWRRWSTSSDRIRASSTPAGSASAAGPSAGTCRRWRCCAGRTCSRRPSRARRSATGAGTTPSPPSAGWATPAHIRTPTTGQLAAPAGRRA